MGNPRDYPTEAGESFKFRLAMDLGVFVSDIEEDMTAHEFMRWAEYYAADAQMKKRAQEKAEAAARRRRR